VRYKSTLLLLVVVAIAGVVAYSLSRKPTSEELGKQRKLFLAEFKTADAQSLAIEEGDKRLVCRRDADGTWRIAEPVQVPADRWEVEGILDKFETAQKVSSAYAERGKPLELAQYGMDKPVRKVAITASAGRTWTILVGKDAPLGDSVFVALQGQEGVYAVAKDVARKAAVTLATLRSKNLAPRIAGLDLKKVALAVAETDNRPASEIECAKTGDKWEILKPLQDLADADKVEAIASKLYDHRIGPADFIVDDPTKAADYGLDKPVLTVGIEGGGKTQTVIFSRHQDADGSHYYTLLKGELPIVRVPESLVSDLGKQASDLRSQTVAKFEVPDVSQVAVTAPAGSVTLKKEGANWRITGDNATTADNDVVDKLLRDLKEARVQTFVADKAEDLDSYGLSEGKRRVVTLKKANDETLAQITLGDADDKNGTVHAMRGSYLAVLALKKEDYLDKLAAGRVAFLDRLVLQEAQADAVEIFTEGQAGRFRCKWDTKAASWGLLEPVEGKADQSAVQSIVSYFAHLRAEAFATEKADDLARFGLQKPDTTVKVTYEPPKTQIEKPPESKPAAEPRVRTLFIGTATESPAKGFYAKLADDERVFVLPEYMVVHCRGNLASKEIYTASELTGMTLHKGDKTVKLVYDSAKPAWTDSDGKALAPEMATAVEGAARLLRNFAALSVADYSDKGAGLYGFDKPYLTVELEEKTTKGKQVVIGNETENGNRYAKGPVTGFVHVASKADVDKLNAVFEPAAAPEKAGDAAEKTEEPAAKAEEPPARTEGAPVGDQ